MARTDEFTKRNKRFFEITEEGISEATIDREFDIAKTRFPVVYGDEQAAKPGTLPHLKSLMYAFDMIRARNPNLVEPTMFLGAWEIEREAISMISSLFNHPNYSNPNYDPQKDPVFGWFTDGGTGSILQAGWAFRNKFFRDLEERLDPNFDRTTQKGIFREEGYCGSIVKGIIDPKQPPVILAPTDLHFAGDKVADVMGIGSSNIIRYGINKDSSTDYKSLEHTLKKLSLEGRKVMFAFATAGSVDTGRVEDVSKLAKTLQTVDYNIPIIVDAAQQYMMLSLLQDKYPTWDFREECVSAIVADPHKTDASTYPGSVIIFKNKNMVFETQNETGYLHLDDVLDYDMKQVWNLMPQFPTSRSPIGAISTWAYLSLLGKSKLTDKYTEMLDLTKVLADYIKKSPHFELITEPQTGIVSFHTNDFNDENASRIYQKFEGCTEHPRFYISRADCIRAKSLEDYAAYTKEKNENGGKRVNGFGGLYIQIMNHMTPKLMNQLIDRLDLFGYEIMRMKRCA